MPKLRMGLIGGSKGFIGEVHRMAATMDGDIELVCGAFSSNPASSLAHGQSLHIDPSRCYADYQSLIASELKLPKDRRADFITVATPNHLHYEISAYALKAGFHVFCDKPATMTLDEALNLKVILQETGLKYGLAHVYAGYPLVQEARSRISAGDLGLLRKVVVEYPQGWLSDPTEHVDSWRMDPKIAGASCCMGDIGIHAAHLAEYVTGAKIQKVCADLNYVIEGRVLDDDGVAILELEDSGHRKFKGLLMASQVCVGEENGLHIRIYGEKGSLEWHQQEPNSLVLKRHSEPNQILRAGAEYLCHIARRHTRLPMGHPEGFIEAFANLYVSFAAQIQQPLSNDLLDCPNIDDAIRGMAFVESVIVASESNQKWHLLKTNKFQN